MCILKCELCINTCGFKNHMHDKFIKEKNEDKLKITDEITNNTAINNLLKIKVKDLLQKKDDKKKIII